MNEGLEPYFERELTRLHALAADFARGFPAEAGRLLPDPQRVADPHLERFIEAIAAVTGRIHRKLDTEFPQLTHALLEIFYPHFLRPIPSMAIARFDPDADAAAGVVIPRHTRLHTLPLGEPPLSCTWRTGYPVHVWPVRVVRASVEGQAPAHAPPRTRAVVRLQLECLGGATFADLALDCLRLYLNGESQTVASLYEALLHHTLQVVIRPLDRPDTALTLASADVLTPVGCGPDEDLLPCPDTAFAGHRLLMEFLSFPAKFHFLDLGGWSEVRAAQFGRAVEVLFYLGRRSENLEAGVTAASFQLGCTPIINIFAKSAEPIALTQTKPEYRVAPSRAHPLGMEVFEIESVAAVDERAEVVPYHPFHDYGLGESRDNRCGFWHATRRPSERPGDPGTEVDLVIVDRAWQPTQPANAALHVRTLCTNRDWPHRFQRGRDVLVVDPSADPPPGPVIALHAPTPALRPPLGRAAHWRLLAQLGLNHKPFADPLEGLENLKEALRLCDFTDPVRTPLPAAVNRQIIDGLTALRTHKTIAPVTSAEAIGYGRGLAVALEIAEKNMAGVGALLVASVLERFFALSAAVNSFSQLTVRASPGEFARTWPPRSAHTPLR